MFKWLQLAETGYLDVAEGAVDDFEVDAARHMKLSRPKIRIAAEEK